MYRRRFLQGFSTALLSTTVASQVTASGPDVPPYVFIRDDQGLIDQFEEEQVAEKDGDSWSWALTRYTHKEKAKECSEKLGLDAPPYSVYIYHLNAGRELDLDSAIEKEGTCIDLGFQYKVGSVNAECVTSIDSFGSEPAPTEVAEKGMSLFQDQLEEDLPISSGEWEFGLKTPGLITESEWEYTKSDAKLLDKKTFTAVIDSEEREEIDDSLVGANDLDVRGLLTTEHASQTGHYVAVIGVVPDSDSVDTEGLFTDPVEFSPEKYRDNIRTLKKSVSA